MKRSLAWSVCAIATLAMSACGSSASTAPTTTGFALGASTDASTTAAPTTAAATTTAAASSTMATGGTLSADMVKQLTTIAMKGLETSGAKADEACVAKTVAKLSEADAKIIIANPDTAETSAEGATIGAQLLLCLDRTDMAKLLAAQMGSIPGLDSDCAAKAIAGMTDSELTDLATASANGEPDMQDPRMARILQLMMGCATGTSTPTT